MTYAPPKAHGLYDPRFEHDAWASDRWGSARSAFTPSLDFDGRSHAAWLVSALLDRGDGEFARLIGRSTQHGHVLDYWGDVAINALIFFAIGVNLRHGALGDGSILIGSVVAVVIAMAATSSCSLKPSASRSTQPRRKSLVKSTTP